MSRPVLLDLFCGAGGAAMGYWRAGFEVMGVDIDPQPHYPFTFIQNDAFDALTLYYDHVDVIHASPPCQAYSQGVRSASSVHTTHKGKDEPALILSLYEELLITEMPFVIENVPGARAHMPAPITLCGTMFHLPVRRHRIFSSNIVLKQPEHPECTGHVAQMASWLKWDRRDLSVTGKGRTAGTSERWSRALGIDWHMTQEELSNAIPPAYTEYIGRQLLEVV